MRPSGALAQVGQVRLTFAILLACLPASGVCSQLSATTTRWRIFQDELRGRRERATTSAPRRSSGDDDVGAFVADSLSADAEWSLKVDDGTT